MGYIHIKDLYRSQDILLFKECYAMEKIHGTSAHISWKDSKLSFFSGGVDYLEFINLFNKQELEQNFTELGIYEIIVFGEAYGGKCQGMRATYGDNLKFVVFDVKIDNMWLNVPNAEKVARSLGFDFVSYTKCSTKLESLDYEREQPSVQAVKCGIKEKRKREGVVLRPLIELRKNNGDRVIAKHKNDEFMETKTPRKVDEKDLKILEQVNEIVKEWVTEMRLTHVLDKLPNATIEQTGNIIKAMIEDIEREAEEEIVKSKKARKAISKETALMFKRRLQNKLYEEES